MGREGKGRERGEARRGDVDSGKHYKLLKTLKPLQLNSQTTNGPS